eukprot:scaffold72357_cov54-Phaeocystis_antarctica.AAC.1
MATAPPWTMPSSRGARLEAVLTMVAVYSQVEARHGTVLTMAVFTRDALTMAPLTMGLLTRRGPVEDVLEAAHTPTPNPYP